MKSSNLAVRPADEQTQDDRRITVDEVAAVRESPRPVVPRPRRSLEFRAIVLRDQGFAPFRVR
jgi:hypothetical protein